MKSVILKPRLSEKAYALSEKLNTYIFEVPAQANSQSIAKAVKAQYEVDVIRVRIAAVPGKAKQIVRRRRISGSGKRSDIRKAYVTLKDGDKLPIFAAVEEAGVPEKETKK